MDRAVNPGEEVVLECQIRSKSRNSRCDWQRDGFPVGLEPGKYEWSGGRNRGSGNCGLRIINADIKFDDGD